MTTTARDMSQSDKRLLQEWSETCRSMLSPDPVDLDDLQPLAGVKWSSVLRLAPMYSRRVDAWHDVSSFAKDFTEMLQQHLKRKLTHKVHQLRSLGHKEVTVARAHSEGEAPAQPPTFLLTLSGGGSHSQRSQRHSHTAACDTSPPGGAHTGSHTRGCVCHLLLCGVGEGVAQIRRVHPAPAQLRSWFPLALVAAPTAAAALSMHQCLSAYCDICPVRFTEEQLRYSGYYLLLNSADKRLYTDRSVQLLWNMSPTIQECGIDRLTHTLAAHQVSLLISRLNCEAKKAGVDIRCMLEFFSMIEEICAKHTGLDFRQMSLVELRNSMFSMHISGKVCFNTVSTAFYGITYLQVLAYRHAIQ